MSKKDAAILPAAKNAAQSLAPQSWIPLDRAQPPLYATPMIVALLSDTHDNPVTTLAAMAIFAEHRPGVYLHAGDLVSPEMLVHFQGLPFHFVFGNNEYDHASLRSRAKSLNLDCRGNVAEFTFDGKRLVMLHGHEHGLMQKLIADGSYDYLIHGHTHVRRDERVGRTRIINPGALQRARTKSVALLDTATDALTFLPVLPSPP
ncbi:MAG: metallophosphoesterase family protein [Phycisphaerae bacterium]